MKVGNILALLLGLVVLAFVVRAALHSSGVDSPGAASGPKQQLDNVRAKARDIENDAQKRADDLAKKFSQ